jgi:nucleotide sugar dehydrogenase
MACCISDVVNKVCVIGCGFVGEHLISVFKNNYDVTGVDVSVGRIAMLKKKYQNLSTGRIIKFQTTYDNIEENNVFLIAVPTLVTGDKKIDLSYIYKVKEQLLKIVKPGSLVVVESSVYVGATREIFGDFIKMGICVGFSPERVDPGRKVPSMEEIPKVVSGLDEMSLNYITNIYNPVFNKVVQVSSCECAEMCKLYENCFRMINIAYVNEIADMCESHGINTKEMINASATKPFGFMPFNPGLGVGGHCIPVNPYYLFQNGELPILSMATKLMEYRPAKKADELIAKYPYASNILLCGVGFKKGESLTTNSPGYELYKELIKRGKNISVYDPIVEECYMKHDIEFVSKMTYETVQNYDLIIINLPLEGKEYECIRGVQKNSLGLVSVVDFNN